MITFYYSTASALCFFFFLITSLTYSAGVDELEARYFRDNKSNTLPYRIYVPKNYSDTGDFALLLFFHGYGGSGTDNKSQVTDVSHFLVFTEEKNQKRWPCFVVAPQTPKGLKWVNMEWGEQSGEGKFTEITWSLAASISLIDSLLSQYPAIDSTRLFVSGISMGGFATFDAICRYPEKFRAAVPICGGGDPKKVTATPKLKNIPLWVFHNTNDPVIPVNRSREMVKAFEDLKGVKPKYTERTVSQNPHDAWTAAYGDTNLLRWLFDTVGTDTTGKPVIHIAPILKPKLSSVVSLPQCSYNIAIFKPLLSPNSLSYTLLGKRYFYRTDIVSEKKILPSPAVLNDHLQNSSDNSRIKF